MSKFKGSIIEGDVDMDGDIVVGDVEIGTGDVDTSQEGDLEGALKRFKRKTTKGSAVNLHVNPAASAPATVLAQSVAETSKDVSMGMPGMALNATLLPPVVQANARTVAPGTQQKIQGWVLRHNIERMLAICTWSTYSETAIQTTGSLTITVGTDEIPSPSKRFLIPVFFLTITGSALQSQAGSRITISWVAEDEFGVPAANDTWAFERVNLTKSMQFSIIPYFRVKDSIKPVLASIFNENTVGELKVTAKFSVTISGLVAGESAQLVVPGLDSSELRAFCRAWNLNIQ